MNPLDALKNRAALLGRSLTAEEGLSMLAAKPAPKPLTKAQRVALACCDRTRPDGTAIPACCGSWGSTTVHVLRERGLVTIAKSWATITEAGRAALAGQS